MCLRVFSPPRVCSDGWGLATAIPAPGEQGRLRAKREETVAVNCLTLYLLYTLPLLILKTLKICGQQSDTPRRQNKLRRNRIGLPPIVLSFGVLSASEKITWATGSRRDWWHRGKNWTVAGVIMGEAVEWMVGVWERDSVKEMTRQRDDSADRSERRVKKRLLFLSVAYRQWQDAHSRSALIREMEVGSLKEEKCPAVWRPGFEGRRQERGTEEGLCKCSCPVFADSPYFCSKLWRR